MPYLRYARLPVKLIRTLPLVAALLAFWSPTFGTGSAVANGTLQGPNVVTYTHNNTLNNATQAIVQWARGTNGECLLAGSARGGPNDPPRAARELAFDPDTCRSIWEQGERPEPLPKPPASGSGSGGSKVTGETLNTAGLGQSEPLGSDDPTLEIAQTPPEYTAHMESYFTDPVAIVVNSAFTFVDYTVIGLPNNPCFGYNCGGWYETWYIPSGWYQVTPGTFTHGTDIGGYYPTGCNWTDAMINDAWMKNDVFGGGLCGSTTSHYIVNQVVGWIEWQVGGWTVSYSATKNGTCSSLLSFNVDYGPGD